MWWGKHNRDLETFRQYLGHTVRMSVWAKSENLSARAGLDFQAKGPNGEPSNRVEDSRVSYQGIKQTLAASLAPV